MHALLNILLNCTTIEIGKELNHFKQFTHDFPPAVNINDDNNYNKTNKYIHFYLILAKRTFFDK